MNKVLMSLLFGLCLLTAPSFAQNPPPAAASTPVAAAPAAVPVTMKSAHHAEIHRAIRKLRAAKQDLEKATRDFGGHKAKAIAAIDQALMELKAAMDFDKN